MAIELSVKEKHSTLEESCAQQKKLADILIAVNLLYPRNKKMQVSVQVVLS